MIGRITPRKLNADTDDRSLSADEMKRAINIAVDSDSDGDGGVVKFADGNAPISPSDVLSGVEEGVNTVIGSVSDEELSVVYFFVHNSLGKHGVYACSLKTNTYRKIFSGSILDFDENGFVKGDVVRIKRKYELEAPEIVIGQGDQGGTTVNPGAGGGGGTTEPIGSLSPETIKINVGRDLYPLIELDASLMTRYGDGIGWTIGPVGYEAVISGTYAPSGVASRSTPEPIVFYDSADLDLNLNQEGVSEVVVQTIEDGLILDLTEGDRSVYLELDRDVFVHPDVTVDGTLDITVVLRPIDPSLKLDTILYEGNVYDYLAEVSNESMSETIEFSNVSGIASSVGSDSNNHPVIRIPEKTRLDLTVNDVYGDTYITYLGDNPVTEGYLLEYQKKILSCRVNDTGEFVSIQYEQEEDVPSMKLTDRSIPVKIEIDYKDSSSYQAFKSLWEDQQNANTSDIYDVPSNTIDPAGDRSSLRVPDNTTTSVIYYTFCPFSMSWSIVGNHPASISYEDADGFKTYDQLVADATSYYAQNSNSLVPWTGNDGPYTSLSSVYSQIQSISGDQWNFEADGTFPNWIAVQIGVGGTETCPVPEAEDVFNPVLVVAPVVQNGESKYKQPRIVRPQSYPGQYDSGEEAINALVEDSIFTFVVDIPMAVYQGSTSGSADDYDFLLVSYNNSEYAAFRGAEDVVFENYDAEIKTIDYNYIFQVPVTNSVYTSERLNDEYRNLQIFSDEDRRLPYFFSVSGSPAEIQELRGRRIRVTPFAGDFAPKKIIKSLIHDPEAFDGNVDSRKFVGLVLTPSINLDFSKKFCYGFGTSCDNTEGLIPPKDIRVPDAPVITGGDAQQEDDVVGGGDVTIIGDVRTDAPTTTPTKTVPPKSSGLSAAPKTTPPSTTTKKTIKKKY